MNFLTCILQDTWIFTCGFSVWFAQRLFLSNSMATFKIISTLLLFIVNFISTLVKFFSPLVNIIIVACKTNWTYGNSKRIVEISQINFSDQWKSCFWDFRILLKSCVANICTWLFLPNLLHETRRDYSSHAFGKACVSPPTKLSIRCIP